MGRRYTDNALTLLAGSISAEATTLTVTAATGDNFPAVTGRGAAGAAIEYFVITLEDASHNIEKIRVEHREDDVLGSVTYPLVRGYDGTLARVWVAGDAVDLRQEREGVQAFEDKIAAIGYGKLYGINWATTAGLVFGWYGGPLPVDGVFAAIADGTIAITASQTNYLEHDRAGTVSTNTVGFTAGRFPIGEAVTDTEAMTAWTDRRLGYKPAPGMLTKNVAGGAGTTVLTAAEARNDIFVFTGVLTGNRVIQIPALAREIMVRNDTSGAFTLTVKTAAGVGALATQGATVLLFCDGVDTETVGGAGGSLIEGDVIVTGTLTVNDIIVNNSALFGGEVTFDSSSVTTFEVGAQRHGFLQAVEVTGDITLAAAHDMNLLVYNTEGSAPDVTLPDPATLTNMHYSGIRNTSGFDITVTAHANYPAILGGIGEVTSFVLPAGHTAEFFSPNIDVGSTGVGGKAWLCRISVELSHEELQGVPVNFVVSSLTDPLVAGVSDYAWYPAFDGSFLSLQAAVAVPSATLLSFDVLINGVSIFTTPLSIDGTEQTSLGATTPYALNPATSSFVAGDEVTFECLDDGDGLAVLAQIAGLVLRGS